uniref:Uncharacterized protein n=1 Tax=Anguilla anguilla TaxID=7936 RepID=A0A0E9R4Y0_ANGAN
MGHFDWNKKQTNFAICFLTEFFFY